jgi:hypothetical protein
MISFCIINQSIVSKKIGGKNKVLLGDYDECYTIKSHQGARETKYHLTNIELRLARDSQFRQPSPMEHIKRKLPIIQ